MKSSHRPFDPPREKPSFPCLMESRSTPGLIVLFNKECEGMVVVSPGHAVSGIHQLGRYSQSWISDNFDVYRGKITIDTEA